ncbi:MAG: leucine-rich repeat domain-containing protein [Prevotella sp.]|nr:leucine-rich repeat domain-containing protein [Prevotella sp.]
MKMKNFTKKIFLMSIAIMLSASVTAQDEITHRYPAIPYEYDGHTYEMPAWDIYFSQDGKTRVQTIAPLPTTNDGHFKGKIVARRVFNNDDPYKNGDYMFSSNPTEANVTIGGESLPTGNKKWTYGLACDILGIEIADEAREMPVFDSTEKKGTDYTIPSTYTVSNTSGSDLYRNRTFDIVEIGVGAFRNYTPDPTKAIFLNITRTLTIPNTITKIEHNAFRHGVFKKVVFEEGSTIETIEKATFEGCKYLEEINIPASVTKINGTAFGSCGMLNKVVFEGSLPTLTLVDEEPLYSGYTGPYNIFEGCQRLQSGTSGPNVDPVACIIEVPLGSAKSYVDSNDGLFKQFPMSSKFPITTSSGLMTYCSDLDFTFKQYNTSDKTWSAGGITAYYVEDNADAINYETEKITLTEITDDVMVPGWSETEDFGVVLRKVSDDSYIFYPNNCMTEKLSMATTGNCLKGVIVETPINVEAEENENNSYFILSGGKFHRVTTNGNCKANRAYICIGDGGYDQNVQIGNQSFALSFPGEETGIENHVSQIVEDDAFYTLQGIKVKQPQRGLVIKNGKKYIIK